MGDIAYLRLVAGIHPFDKGRGSYRDQQSGMSVFAGLTCRRMGLRSIIVSISPSQPSEAASGHAFREDIAHMTCIG